MKLQDIGQFGLIDLIAGLIEKDRDIQSESWRNVIEGAGDDCAVWKGNTANQFAKVDCQVEGVHFNLANLSWEDLGWKSLAVNLSDIASMGGLPRYALVSLGLPPDTEVQNVLSFYRGLLRLAGQSDTAVVGGNVSSSSIIFVDVSVIGQAANPDGHYLSRKEVRTGDLIAVTGWLGNAVAGLRVLQGKTTTDGEEEILRRSFSRPEPRLAEGRLLVEKGVRAGIDISDGLISDLGHLCKASSVSAVVYLDKLPVHSVVKRRFPEKYIDFALSGGEDYQLLFTATPDIMRDLEKTCSCPLTVIGEVVSRREPVIQILDESGREYRVSRTGWDHFKNTDKI
ncbi:MAG TPA: thiamine-phosphate kinase [Dehalococcoidales bacterium]|nr:thiamine-phosphate kinase [Dehalococcoidales bacterium]